MRLLDGDGRPVARAGAWDAVASVRLALEVSPVSLPNDLALLPLPFVNRGFDQAASVPVVLGAGPTAERTRLAALVAGWLALDAPIPVEFTAREALPDGRAVVLVAGPAEASRLGLDPPRGPAIRMADHPAHPGSNAKLLVVEGRDAAELRGAVESLVARAERLVGEAAPLPPVRPVPPAAPYSAPRWIPSGRVVPFSEYPQGGVPAHEGATSATLRVRFRVSPDLSIWPSDHLVLDLGWSERLPAGVPAPRLDVELNGYFLATLPAPPGPGEATRHVRLRVPREHMRGYNELRLYVSYPEGPATSAAPPRVAITGDSVLHLEGLSHHAALPDVALFAYDGFPFSRVPNLGDTAVVLPALPTADELGAVLTIAAQLAQVTGRVRTRATFLDGADATDAALSGKDVLAVGAADRQPLAAQWRTLLPLAMDGARARAAAERGPPRARARGRPRPRARPAPRGGRARGRARGRRGRAPRDRVARVARARRGARDGRRGIRPAAVPPLPRVRRGAEPHRQRRAPPRRRAALDVPDRAVVRERVARWLDRLRWFLANHWVLLVPVLVAGVLVLARELRRGVAGQVRRRLALLEAPP